MQHVPSVQRDQQKAGGRFPLFVIGLLILLVVALLLVTSVPEAFAPVADSSGAYQNPELWAFERYEAGSLPASFQGGVELEAPVTNMTVSSNLPSVAVNPELGAFHNWQNAAALRAEARFLTTNPEVGLFHRWQASK